MLIEVFSSPGCSKCSHAKQTLKALVVELGQERIEWREVNVLDELDHAVELGVLSTPAIAVDGELVFTSLPNTGKLRDYLLQKVEANK
ncbi:MAG: thioredoxin family protein [Gammaproteobacteria bacterium]|nr:thioredoxin family protein [Gammaproteobacteria bacterium]